MLGMPVPKCCFSHTKSSAHDQINAATAFTNSPLNLSSPVGVGGRINRTINCFQLLLNRYWHIGTESVANCPHCILFIFLHVSPACEEHKLHRKMNTPETRCHVAKKFLECLSPVLQTTGIRTLNGPHSLLQTHTFISTHLAWILSFLSAWTIDTLFKH